VLHELAHLRRHDPLTQAIAQLARALHWFNPLAWLAVRCLRVEQERACDDYVLRGGVNPCDYAGHVLELATTMQPAPRAASVALAMADRTRIEGRLQAILDTARSRRRLSRSLVALTVLVAGSVACSLAMLHAADEKNDDAGQEQLEQSRTVPGSDDLSGSPASTPPSDQQPKNKEAQALFKRWQDSARTDGKIPGGALRSLAGAVTNFMKLNPTHDAVPKLNELLKRIDTSHDWTQADAVALLDDVTAIYPTLPDWAWDGVGSSIVRPGEPLPAEFAGAAWGEPAANGLRAAWVLEPRTEQHPLGTNLKARILFHNTGKETVVFRTPDWHQHGARQARDGQGAVIKVSATLWLREVGLVTIRLAPGEYAEVPAHAIGVGARNKGEENWAGLRVAHPRRQRLPINQRRNRPRRPLPFAARWSTTPPASRSRSWSYRGAISTQPIPRR
jgi:hypothetical protein